jgi:hypothetical protein
VTEATGVPHATICALVELLLLAATTAGVSKATELAVVTPTSRMVSGLATRAAFVRPLMPALRTAPPLAPSGAARCATTVDHVSKASAASAPLRSVIRRIFSVAPRVRSTLQAALLSTAPAQMASGELVVPHCAHKLVPMVPTLVTTVGPVTRTTVRAFATSAIAELVAPKHVS